MDWRELAEGLLANERKTKPFHRPPSIGIIVEWHGERRVGCVQWPVLAEFPAVVFISIISVYVDPEFVKAIRNLDPGRQILTADERLDLKGNFHILRREGNQLTFMTAKEVAAVDRSDIPLLEIRPSRDGIVVRPVLHRATMWKQKPEDN